MSLISHTARVHADALYRGRYSEKKDGELFTVDIVGDPEGESTSSSLFRAHRSRRHMFKRLR